KAIEGLALIQSLGYRASARRIRHKSGSRLYSSFDSDIEGAKRLEEWLYSDEGSLPCHFWGDLDFAGLDILRELRTVFPGLTAWKPGYSALLRMQAAGFGHTPDEADKQGQ